jgi:hypothetical protein
MYDHPSASKSEKQRATTLHNEVNAELARRLDEGR